MIGVMRKHLRQGGGVLLDPLVNVDKLLEGKKRKRKKSFRKRSLEKHMEAQKSSRNWEISPPAQGAGIEKTIKRKKTKKKGHLKHFRPRNCFQEFSPENTE